VTDEHALLLEQLSSEYRILQDKIDKIGAFRFTVRGWSVTIVVASIFAVGSTKLVSPLLLLLLLPFTFSFYSMEREQNQIRGLFMERVGQIEKEIRRVIRANRSPGNLSHEVGLTPRIAHHLSAARRSSERVGTFFRSVGWVLDPFRFFYAAQFLVVVVATLLLAFGGFEKTQLPSPPTTVIEYHRTESDTKSEPAKAALENEKRQNKKKETR
jgi:hypothetical protein